MRLQLSYTETDAMIQRVVIITETNIRARTRTLQGSSHYLIPNSHYGIIAVHVTSVLARECNPDLPLELV